MDLYENDCIFDRFQCSFTHDGSSVVTGSYNGLFSLFSSRNGSVDAVEATVDFVSGLSGKHLYSTDELINEGASRQRRKTIPSETVRIMGLVSRQRRKGTGTGTETETETTKNHSHIGDPFRWTGIANSGVADLVEPTRRVLHVDASPAENIYSVACGPALYIFHS